MSNPLASVLFGYIGLVFTVAALSTRRGPSEVSALRREVLFLWAAVFFVSLGRVFA